MACLEEICTNDACGWREHTNIFRRTCPRCGSLVRVYSDEEPE